MLEPSSTVLPLWPQDDLAAVTREIIVLDNPDDPNAIKRVILRPSLVIYQPRRDQSNHKGILVVPGGAYRRLYLTRGGYDFADFLVAHGYTVALLKYRMSNPTQSGAGTPLPIVDALRAVRLLRSRAAALGVDPHRIGVVGTSAGGHVAAGCAAFGDDGDPNAADSIGRFSSRPDFLVLHSPVISMDPAIMGQSIRVGLLGENPDPRMAERYSLEKRVGRKWPPTLIVVARDDRLSPVNSYRLISAIKQAGLPVDSLIYDHGGHAFALANLRPPLTEWPQKWLDWMQAQTGTPP